MQPSKPVLTTPNTYSTRTPNRNTSGFPTGPLVDRCCSRWLGCWEVSTNPSAQYPKLPPPSLEGLVAVCIQSRRGSTNGWGGKRWQSQNQLETIVEIFLCGQWSSYLRVSESQRNHKRCQNLNWAAQKHMRIPKLKHPPQLKCRPHMASCNQITLSCSQFGQTYRW